MSDCAGKCFKLGCSNQKELDELRQWKKDIQAVKDFDLDRWLDWDEEVKTTQATIDKLVEALTNVSDSLAKQVEPLESYYVNQARDLINSVTERKNET